MDGSTNLGSIPRHPFPKIKEKGENIMRYYIADAKNIPFHSQPENGYTKLGVLNRAHRELAECVELFGGTPKDYTSWIHILNQNFNRCKDIEKGI